MATPYTLALADAILKEIYADGMKDESLTEGVLFGMLPKAEGGGDGKVYPVIASAGGASSSTFSSAQANSVVPDDVSFKVGGVTDLLSQSFAVGQIGGRAFEAMAGGGRKAFRDGLERLVDSAMGAAIKRMSWGLYGSRNNVLGIVLAYTPGASDFTITVPQNHPRWGTNVEIVTSATATGALDAGSFTVTGVSGRGTGTVTITSDAAIDGQIVAFAAGRYCFIQGDHVTATDNLGIAGLEDWNPAAAPGSTAFFGVDRSTEPERLGGFRYDASGYPSIEQGLILGLNAHHAALGAKPDTLVMHPDDFAALVVELSAKNTYERMDVPVRNKKGPVANMGFSGCSIVCSYGVVNVVPDTFADKSVARALTLSSWELLSAGPCPMLDNRAGSRIRLVHDADAYEIRVKGYKQLACNDPGANARIVLP